MKILLVDDQVKILEACRKLVHWEQIGVDSVYTANNAAEAKVILEREQIDIMLTDIEMPGEDGIALQKWQIEHYPSVTSIFLTSHADFSYAQEAIRNGAFDYILQPAAFPEIEKTVLRCIEHLEEQRLIRKKCSRYDAQRSDAVEKHVFFMFHQKQSFANMREWKIDSGTQEETWWYLPCLLEFSQNRKTEVKETICEILKNTKFGTRQEIRCSISQLDETQIGVLFYGQEAVPERTQMKACLQFAHQEIVAETGGVLNLYLGDYAQDDLPEKIGQIYQFCSGKLLKQNEVYLVDEQKTFQLRRPNGTVWGSWLIRRDMALVRNQIINILHYTEQEGYLTISYMQQILHAFLEACSIACYQQKLEMSELFTEQFTYEEMLHSYRSVEKLCAGVDFCLRRYEELLPEEERAEGSVSPQERIKEILRYLDDNMERMISRREATKYVFLNEDYFSRIFQKETGMRYKEYVMKQKMNYAGKLLLDTDLPVTLIASKVGYDDFNNFTKTFRKMEEMTPTEYRKKYKSEK